MLTGDLRKASATSWECRGPGGADSGDVWPWPAPDAAGGQGRVRKCRRLTHAGGHGGEESAGRERQALLLRVQGDERALQGFLPRSLGEAGRWLPQPGRPHGVEGLGHLGGCALRLVIL